MTRQRSLENGLLVPGVVGVECSLKKKPVHLSALMGTHNTHVKELFGNGESALANRVRGEATRVTETYSVDRGTPGTKE